MCRIEDEKKQGSFCGPAEAFGAIPREDRRGARDGHRARSVFWDKVFGSRFQRLSGKGEVLAPPGAGILMICFPWQHTEKPSSLQLHCSCSLAKFRIFDIASFLHLDLINNTKNDKIFISYFYARKMTDVSYLFLMISQEIYRNKYF